MHERAIVQAKEKPEKALAIKNGIRARSSNGLDEAQGENWENHAAGGQV